jgi:hypothetical protein
LAIIAAARICAAVPASAIDVGVGVGVGPVGAGVTVGSDHRDRDQTTVIKERGREPDRKVIIDREERESCGLRSELHLTPEMSAR